MPLLMDNKAYKNNEYSHSTSSSPMDIDKEPSPILTNNKESETKGTLQKYPSLDEDEKPLCIHEEPSDDEMETNNKISPASPPPESANSLKIEV